MVLEAVEQLMHAAAPVVSPCFASSIALRVSVYYAHVLAGRSTGEAQASERATTLLVHTVQNQANV